MVYISPRLDAQLIQGGYEAVEDPVFVAQNPQRIKTFSRSVESLLARTGLSPKDKRLLDVGCAGGAFPVAARAFGFEVAGVEPSQWLSAYARREYGLDVRQGILQPGMFPDHSFDVISLWDVIEHVPDPHSTFTLIRSLLKPDGFLWVNYPDIGSLAARLMGWKWPFWLSVHLHYYRRPTIARQIEGAGFEIAFMQPHWQQLRLGYVMQRAHAIAPVLMPVKKIVQTCGLSNVPFTYNMGQTMVVAKVNQARD
jgi:SAM-dependent methyltransferase